VYLCYILGLITYHLGTHTLVWSRAVSHISLDHLYTCAWYIISVYNTFQGQPHITLVYHCLGSRLYRIVTYIPGQFSCMLPFWPRAVSHIPGPFACMFPVHHYFDPGLFRIHSRANHILPWYIIYFVQGYVTYIPGPLPCILLVHHCLGPGLVKIHPRDNHLSP
jgi:hypothetical protein